MPEDAAVVGFDDVPQVAEWTDPPPATVHQDIEGMGRLMARSPLRGLEGQEGSGEYPPPSSVIVPTRLVRRTSA